MVKSGYFCTREVNVEAIQTVLETRNRAIPIEIQAAMTKSEPVIEKKYLLESLADSDILAIAKNDNTCIAFLSAYKKTDVIGEDSPSMHIDIVCKNTQEVFHGVAKIMIEAIIPLCIGNSCEWLELRAISPDLVNFYRRLGFTTVNQEKDTKFGDLRRLFETDEDFHLKHGTLMRKPIPK